jgi:hypothetical protein
LRSCRSNAATTTRDAAVDRDDECRVLLGARAARHGQQVSAFGITRRQRRDDDFVCGCTLDDERLQIQGDERVTAPGRTLSPSGREMLPADYQTVRGTVDDRARDHELLPRSIVVAVRARSSGNTQHRQNRNQPPK